MNFFTAGVDVESKTIENGSQKFLESFEEIKMTKSTGLNEVIEKNKKIDKFDNELSEGTLIRVENVKLSLGNEMELRTVK